MKKAGSSLKAISHGGEEKIKPKHSTPFNLRKPFIYHIGTHSLFPDHFTTDNTTDSTNWSRAFDPASITESVASLSTLKDMNKNSL